MSTFVNNQNDCFFKKMFECKLCNYSTSKKNNFSKHSLTIKHKRMIFQQNGTKFVANGTKFVANGNLLGENGNAQIATSFSCANCDKTYKARSGLWKHLKNCITPPLETTNQIIDQPVCTTTASNIQPFSCDNCQKQYKERSGLWRHKQKCKPSDDISIDPNNNLTNAIIEMVKQNQEFHQKIFEMVKENKQLTINNTTNNNTTNNNFNLNVFLNETCKDALNMVDFVNSLHLQLTDLEETGKLGHSDGISRIFVNGLKVLDVNKRPIHCSDLKREVLYIKEGDVWEKDNDDKTLIKRAISKVESKNINQIPLWVKAHPECAIGSNRENTKYLKMVIQCTGGDNCDSNGNINKIIKNIAKEVVIDKLK